MEAHDRDNRIRWNPEDRGGHVESHFVKANDPLRPRAFWLKYTILAPTQGPTQSHVWAIAFDPARGNVAAKTSFPIEQSKHAAAPFRVTAPDFELDGNGLRGGVDGHGHKIRFDLRHTARSQPFRPFPFEWMYTAGFPRLKLLTPYPDELWTGTLEVDGEPWEVERWPGMQGHNWGRAHAERYAWAQCSSFDGAPPGTFFEGFSGKIRLGPLTTPYLTMVALHHEGRTYSPLSPSSLLTKVELDYTRWSFSTQGRGFTLSGELQTTVDRMVGLVYENPGGDASQCLNSKLARCRLRLERPGHAALELRSEHSAALEVLVRETTHPVPMML